MIFKKKGRGGQKYINYLDNIHPWFLSSLLQEPPEVERHQETC